MVLVSTHLSTLNFWGDGGLGSTAKFTCIQIQLAASWLNFCPSTDALRPRALAQSCLMCLPSAAKMSSARRLIPSTALLTSDPADHSLELFEARLLRLQILLDHLCHSGLDDLMVFLAELLSSLLGRPHMPDAKLRSYLIRYIYPKIL